MVQIFEFLYQQSFFSVHLLNVAMPRLDLIVKSCDNLSYIELKPWEIELMALDQHRVARNLGVFLFREVSELFFNIVCLFAQINKLVADVSFEVF